MNFIRLITIGFMVLAVLPNGLSQQKNTMIEKLLKDARQNLVPDKRLEVFNVRATLDSTTLTLKGDIQTEDLRRRLIEFVNGQGGYTVVDSLIVVPHPSLGPKTFGVVSLSVANIRSAPEHSAEMATQAILGTPLKILKKESGWYLLQTPDGYIGWCGDGIATMDRPTYERWPEQPKVIVTTVYGFTYDRADRAAQVVSDVVVGSILGLKGEEDGFYAITYPDGRSGYLSKDEAEHLAKWIEQIAPTPDQIAATAKRFMGIPYLWGGTSSKGMDCSGFTKIVYYLNGYLLPRDADQQSTIGEAADTSDGLAHLQPGDLLFFGAKATPERREHVTHVGISLGGPRFIHASGDVGVNSLDPKAPDYTEYRKKAFIRARRILGTDVQRVHQLPYYNGHAF
jgi:gamma-D-glutamyl-L-lysine dipeptidyl-peptidase